MSGAEQGQPGVPGPPSDHVVAELLETVRALSHRVEHLEAELASVRASVPEPEVPEDVVIAISAAVAAFLGHRARLTAVHFRSGHAWSQQGRDAVHHHTVVHGVR